MTDCTLAVFPRTERTEVRLTLSVFKGQRTIHLRLYYRDAAGDWHPSRKGCALKPDELTAALTALKSAQAEVAP